MSKEFWNKVIGVMTILSLVGTGILSYFMIGFLMELGLDAGPFTTFIFSLMMIGFAAYVYHNLRKEVDKRFSSTAKQGN